MMIKGVGGLPLGTQPSVVCLLSGGFASPVACWLAMRRGCPIIPLYFDNAPFTDGLDSNRAFNSAQILFEWAVGFPRRIQVVPNGENIAEFKEKCPKRLTCILCRRMMYRVAQRIVDLESAEGIVTGECIGKKSNQTLHSLKVLNEAANKYPVHRPLLGFEKIEIDRIARRIGTYERSITRERICTALPNRPATTATLEDVVKAEKKMDITSLMDKTIKSIKSVNL
jgi:thiamine biosynthesis protein ThiI